jgi:phosphate ABC transporter permease protein PstC
MRTRSRSWVKYALPLAAAALSFAVPGVIGWLLLWGGLAAFAAVIVGAAAARFIPRRVREGVVNAAVTAAGYAAVVFIALIFIFIFKEGGAAFAHIPPREFLRTLWQPALEPPRYGVLPLVTGSVLVTFLSLLVAVPVGVGTAVYLAEIAGAREREVIKPVVELLAAVPSVVYGLLGMVVLGDVIPRFTGTPFRLNALNGGLVLAVMLTPMLASLAEDALFSVPHAYRTASYALGATKGETIRRVLLPAASSGVAAAILLALARTVGETMAVLLATGNATILTLNPLSSVRTLTATIAIEMGETAFGSEHYHVLFALGIMLFAVTFAVNLAAEVIMGRFARRYRR